MSSFLNYAYSPLQDPDNCVRLLKLLPAPVDHQQQGLWGELITCYRDKAPPFRPVSYTWGPQDASSQIFLRDTESPEWRRFSISPNLEAFLVQLFLRHSSEPLVFWIDAICINQDDNKEKGCQVRNMDKIYRDRDISIWLGDSSETSDLALDLVEEFARLPLFKTDGNLTEGITEILYNFFTSKSDPIWASSWRGLIDLISRPWFTRRWIVQEYVLSKFKHAHLGIREQGFEFFVIIGMFLREFPYPSHIGAHQIQICEEHGFRHGFPAPNSDPLENLYRLHMAHQAARFSRKSDLTLERLLDNFAGFQSLDPKDGIYAFLSMASDIDPLEWTPDYSITTTEVYMKAVCHIIRTSSSLDIICRRVHVREFASSVAHRSHWIPWFGLQKIELGLNHFHWIHGYNTTSLTTFGQPLATLRRGQPGYLPSNRQNRYCFHSCDGCETEINGTGYRCMDCLDSNLDYCYKCIQTFNHDPGHKFEIHNGAVYFASGRSFCTIEQKIIPSCDFFEANHWIENHSCGFIVDSIRVVGAAAPDFDDMSLTLPWENWMALPGMERFVDEQGVVGDTFFRTLAGNRLIQDGRVCHLPSDLVPTLGRIIDIEISSELPIFLPSIHVMLSNLRRFATTTGQSLGFVPHNTQQGDSVVIIIGCSVPVIIRPVEKEADTNHTWMLVGECYVDGFMEGEAFDVDLRDKLQPQVITFI